MTSNKQPDEATKRLMEALLRQPPKPHEEMKIGKRTGKRNESPDKKAKKQPSKTKDQ